MATDLKTLTPGTAAASSVVVGAASTASANPSLFTTSGSGNVVLSTSPNITSPQLGDADAAAPVAQTLSMQNVVGGTTNTAGVNLTIAGSRGTGTGAGGSIILQTAAAGSSGSTQNALATALTINSAKQVVYSLGSAASPCISGGATGTGIFFLNSGFDICLAYASSQWATITSSQLRIGSAASYSWSSGSSSVAAADTLLTRQAAGVVKVAGASSAGGAILYNGYTFSALPTGVAGAVAYISDASNASPAFGDTVTAGGGSTKVLCWYNGTNWTVIGK